MLGYYREERTTDARSLTVFGFLERTQLRLSPVEAGALGAWLAHHWRTAMPLLGRVMARNGSAVDGGTLRTRWRLGADDNHEASRTWDQF